MKHYLHLFAALVVTTLLFDVAEACAGPLDYVSGTGSGSACTQAMPCTLIYALGNIDDGGEVVCLDAGPYIFTGIGLSRSMTIDCPGVIQPTIADFGALQLAGGQTQVVRVRNATFSGISGGWPAIRVIGGATVLIENCVFQQFQTGNAIAIEFKPGMTGAQLNITDTFIDNNGIAPAAGGGLQVLPASGGSAGVVLNRVRFGFNVTAMVLNSSSGTIGGVMKDSSVVSSRSNGVLSQAGSAVNFIIDHSSLTNNVGAALQSSGANSQMFLNDSTVFGNQTGVRTASGGGIQSYKNNRINGNNTDGTPLPSVPGYSGTGQ